MVLILIGAHNSSVASMTGALGVTHWPPFMADDDGSGGRTGKNDHSTGRSWSGRQELTYVEFINHFKYYCLFQHFKL